MTNSKIKILYLIDSFSIGGAEKFLLDLCKNIDKNRFEIEVGAVVFAGPLIKDFENLNIKVTVFQKKSKLGLGLLGQLYRYIKDSKPDIVHTNLFGADTWGRAAAIWTRVPIIISTEHNINLNESKIKKIVKYILSLFTTKIIAVSQGVKEYSTTVEKIAASKIKIINYGIDLNKFSFRGYKEIDSQQVINAVCVARLTEQKGQTYLIKAMPDIIKAYPKFVLHLVGAGSMFEELKKQAKDLNLLNSVKFHGQLSDIDQFLPSMDLFILPSLWEGLGIAILEAQAIGLPVLASNIPAVREVVKDEQTGLLFEPKNSLAISQTVKKLLTDQQLSEKIVNKAYQQVIYNFSLQTMVNNYSQLYLDIMKK